MKPIVGPQLKHGETTMNAAAKQVELTVIDPNEMMVKAESACDFLKAIATPTRLMLLCNLMEGERTVTELAEGVGAKQSLTSHHLNRLKLSGLVTSRRDEKFIYYSLEDTIAKEMVSILYQEFCKPD